MSPDVQVYNDWISEDLKREYEYNIRVTEYIMREAQERCDRYFRAAGECFTQGTRVRMVVNNPGPLPAGLMCSAGDGCPH